MEFIRKGVVDTDVPNVAKALPLIKLVIGTLKVFKVRADRVSLRPLLFFLTVLRLSRNDRYWRIWLLLKRCVD